MRRNLSRRHSLSLGIFGALGLVAAWSCGGDDSTTAGGTAGNGGAGGTGGGDTGGSAGSGGSTGGSAGSGGSTGGSAGSGGSTGGSAGSGGSTGGAAGTGGSGGGGGAKDAGSGGDGSNPGCGMAVVALISMNHGHALSVAPADIVAGVEMIYSVMGTATHTHYVQITAADFATLKAGGTVIKKSCNSSDHEFVLSCAPPSRQPGAPTCTDECGAMMTNPCPP